MLCMARRILRNIVKFVAIVAIVVFVLDNRLSGNAGLVLLGSIAVLGICLVLWLVFSLGEESHPNPD
jgi:hypothetical protein